MAKKKKAVKAKAPVRKKKAAVKKVAVKKAAVKKAVKPAVTKPEAVYPKLQAVGEITHFFPHVSAGVIKLSGELKVGDMVNIKGHTTDFRQTVDSMQVDHVVVNEAKKGQEIGLKVKDRVRIGDIVYKI